MSIIAVSHLTFAYEGSADNIFNDVSFNLDTDWKLGFTGRNGKGKTTFLKLLQGVYPYAGSISSTVAYEYFPYVIQDTNSTAQEFVNSIYCAYEPWELDKEMSKLQLKKEILEQSFITLSKGEQTKLMIATMFLKKNSFLLIDEPTNHLDAKGRELLAQYLKTKKGFIVVSHDRAFLDTCIDHVLAINRSNIEIQKGNFTSWYENKEKKDQSEFEQNERLKHEITRLQISSLEKAKWSDHIEAEKIGNGPCDRGYIGHKAAKMMKRSKSIERRQSQAIHDKKLLLKNIEETEELKIEQLGFNGRRMILMDDISIYYEQRTITKHVHLIVAEGDRIALSGINGSGKSSILKMILGETISYTGQYVKNPSLKISYVPQDTSFLNGTLQEYAEEKEFDESLFKAILRKLDFTREQFNQRMESYSEGQKKKVLIAGSLCEKSHLLIWDEPLNYIDVFSRMQIEELLLKYHPTILFVEHDKKFTEKIANQTLILEK